MGSDSRRIVAQVGGSRSREPGWLVDSALPSELREGAVRRLGILGLLTACFLVAFASAHALRDQHYGLGIPWDAVAACGCAVLLSLLIFALPRIRKLEASTLLNLGAAYQVAMALLISVTDRQALWIDTSPVRGWSSVGVWILIFAFFVPSTPRRTLWVSSVAALMDPLAVLLTTLWGTSLPSAVTLPIMFGPTALAVVAAVVAARINVRMGRKLHDAQALGAYQLVERLGEGGMGEVWRARHRLLARPAAIKLIRAAALASARGDDAERLLRRFEREAQATALLESEHTIQVYDFGVTTDGSFYYVMELLHGMDLDALVKRYGPVPPQRAIYLLLQVCESLAEAHAGGLIHRDIKPSNIFVCRHAHKHDFVKLLDFGLVKPPPAWNGSEATLTAEGVIHGTPTFLPPEIATGEAEIDSRADIYAVGCVAFWLLAGRLVFDVQSPMKQVMYHASRPPPRLGDCAEQEIPQQLEELVHACLEKSPARRPQSAQALAEQLAAIDCGATWDQAAARAWWQQQGEPRQEVADAEPDATTVPPA